MIRNTSVEIMPKQSSTSGTPHPSVWVCDGHVLSCPAGLQNKADASRFFICTIPNFGRGSNSNNGSVLNSVTVLAQVRSPHALLIRIPS